MRLRCTTVEEIAERKLLLRRASWSLVAAAAIAALTWKAITAPDGVPDPTAAGTHLSHGAVVVDSALLVFREGLEAVLVLAAFTASFVGANRGLRRPVAAGAAVALAASVATWFLAIWVIGALGGPGSTSRPRPGCSRSSVLLVVMNWFFHKVYWTGWISAHNRRRRDCSATPGARARGSVRAGAARLHLGLPRGLRGRALPAEPAHQRPDRRPCSRASRSALALTVAVGVVTFASQHRLPYRACSSLTGVMLGFVLLVMVGESVQEMQLAGWLPTHSLGVGFPGWMGLWFALFPTVEGVVAQVLAARLVIGSYFLAEEVRVRRPKRREFRVAATATD